MTGRIGWVLPLQFEAGSAIDLQWAPWHQQKPEIRARVITKDGTVHLLDPGTLADSEIGREDGAVYSDRHLLQGPLPAVAPGSIVETEVVVRDTMPFFNRGEVERMTFAQWYPVQRMRLVLDAPSSTPLRYRLQLLPGMEPQRTESGDRVRLVFERGPVEALKRVPDFLPTDVPRYPAVTFSTGESWQAVASGYAEQVEIQMRQEDARSLLGDAPGRAAGRQEAVNRIVARLHENVRYTGVEFGEAAIIPRSPSEVLQRKYGDCKDKSTVLVAMLRAAGYPACLALLRTSPFVEVDPVLPGMGLFNHVIVYVPGTQPLWVDATAEYARLGTLPASAQGRLALIVAPDTKELMRTPESVSTDNQSIETREFFLADTGRSRVVETSEVTGGIETSYRAYYARADAKENSKQLTDYVRGAYFSEDVPAFDISDVKDFTQPFRLRLQVANAGRGFTDLTEAVVAIPTEEIASRVPYELRTEAEKKKPGDDAGPPRTADWYLDEASVTEWRYRIHPPAGFHVKSLPGSGRVQMGPAVLIKESREEPDGTVTAILRFDTGARRFSAAQAEDLRKGIVALAAEKPLMVTFAHRGTELLEAGKTREALIEFRAVSSAHPDVAAHRARTALALLDAGFGEAARSEVQKATTMDPKSALAWSTLGWILQHDALGRRFKKGFDYDGALAAYRKAIELDPKYSEARMNLAILLEHNTSGERYGSGAQLKEAIDAYLALGEELKASGVADNLAIDYLMTRQFKECDDFLSRLATTPPRRSLQLAATALGNGPEAAAQRAKTEISDESARRTALSSAAAQLIQMREYAPAAVILSSLARGAENAAEILSQASIFSRLEKYEEMKLSDEDPKTVLIRFMAAFFTPEPTPKDMVSLFSKLDAEELNEIGQNQQLWKGIGVISRMLARRSGLPLPVLLDVIVNNMPISAEGSPDAGFRLRMQLPNGSMAMFIAREDGKYRILDTPLGGPGVGKLVTSLVEKGDIEHSRKWLDWMREETPPTGGDDPCAGSAFSRLWESGRAADRDAVRVAAASLLVESKQSEDAIRTLLSAREQTESSSHRLAINLALATAYENRREYDKLLPIAEGLLNSAPKSNRAFLLVIRAQVGLERWSDAEKTIAARLSLMPEDPSALRSRAILAGSQGKFQEAVEQLRHLTATNRAEAVDWNNLAWDELFVNPVPDDVLSNAQRAATLSQNNDAGILHTLCVALAAAGKPGEARSVMLQTMDLMALDEPDGAIWLAFGRIAQECGENETALAAYRKVQAKQREGDDTTSNYRLAQRWLKLLADSPVNQ